MPTTMVWHGLSGAWGGCLSREVLEGAALVMQARLVRALKRLTIDRPPNVLVFQLKRFEYMFHGSKITKKVQSYLFALLSACWHTSIHNRQHSMSMLS